MSFALPTATDFDRRLQVDGRVGWRIPLTAGFCATPWVGLEYAVGLGDRVGSLVYEESPWVMKAKLRHAGPCAVVMEEP